MMTYILLLAATAAFLVDAWFTRKWLCAARESLRESQKITEQLLNLIDAKQMDELRRIREGS